MYLLAVIKIPIRTKSDKNPSHNIRLNKIVTISTKIPIGIPKINYFSTIRKVGLSFKHITTKYLKIEQKLK